MLVLKVSNKTIKLIIKISLCLFLWALTSCATTPHINNANNSSNNNLNNTSLTNTNYISSTQSKTDNSSDDNNQQTVSANSIRLDALKDEALTLGAQSGLAWRAKRLNTAVEKRAMFLDQAFNFNRLIINGNILPPVLEAAHQSLQLDDSTTIRLSGTVYKIIQQAKFVTTPPNWRQYLIMTYQIPELPSNTLLPRNKQERELWKMYVKQGWSSGVDQANNIYLDSLARLQRDYNGMLLYRELLNKHIVSLPFTDQSDLGVTTNLDHSELRIDDRVLKITALPELNPDFNRWNPIVTATVNNN